MFRVKVDDKTYGVRFQYRDVILVGDHYDRHFDLVADKEERGHIGQSIRTVCQILELNDEERTHEIIATGESTCDLRDQFNKNTGRWLAFQQGLRFLRLIKTDWFTKDKRKLFYEAYFRNHKHKRHIISRREAKVKAKLVALRKIKINTV